MAFDFLISVLGKVFGHFFSTYILEIRYLRLDSILILSLDFIFFGRSCFEGEIGFDVTDFTDLTDLADFTDLTDLADFATDLDLSLTLFDL
jgi:hypothetical protein